MSNELQHRDLIKGILDGERLQWRQEDGWLTIPTPREAIHALVSFPERVYRFAPKTAVWWAAIDKAGNIYDPALNKREAAEDMLRRYIGGLPHAFLRVELGADLKVVDARTEPA